MLLARDGGQMDSHSRATATDAAKAPSLPLARSRADRRRTDAGRTRKKRRKKGDHRIALVLSQDHEVEEELY